MDKGWTMDRRGFVALLGGTAMAGGLMLGGCGFGDGAADGGAAADVDWKDWDAVLAAAKGQEVTWYGYGGEDDRNRWLDEVLAPALKDKYDVTLKVVGMDINDILTQLSGEIEAGGDAGTIDFIWINGENFASTKEHGYLWGPFADYLPNFQKFVDADSPSIAYDFGVATDGYEAPYGEAQMVFWVDGDRFKDVPWDPVTFKAFCEASPGRVTYPEPGDFTGTAFISCLIAGVVGKEEFEKLSSMTEPTEEEVRAIVEPGMEYLKSLNPSLWKQGQTFPADAKTVDQMYADGELVFDMGYGDPQTLVDDGALPASTRSFVFTSGTVGNTNFMAISKNAPHKAAALVAINEVLSPEMQLDQYKVLGKITVLDLQKLSDGERQAFDDVKLGSAQVPLDEQLKVRVSEAAGPVIPILEKIWHDEVPGK